MQVSPKTSARLIITKPSQTKKPFNKNAKRFLKFTNLPGLVTFKSNQLNELS